MRWDEETGAVSRAEGADLPAILLVSKALPLIDDPDALDMNIRRVIDQLTPRPPR
jgi:hypothetical protein